MGLGRNRKNDSKNISSDVMGDLSSPPQSQSSSNYDDDILRSVQALQAQHDEINRSMQNLDRLSIGGSRRGSEALSSFSNSTMTNHNDEIGGLSSMLGRTSLSGVSANGAQQGFNDHDYGYGYDHDLNFTSAAEAANFTGGQLYDLSKLVMAPPATPPPEHTYFDTPLPHSSTGTDNSQNQRPTSRNHQRAHTTALTALPASYAHYDPDYSPSKLLAPLSALARRSSAVEDRIARRRGSQMSLFNSNNSSARSAAGAGGQAARSGPGGEY